MDFVKNLKNLGNYMPSLQDVKNYAQTGYTTAKNWGGTAATTAKNWSGTAKAAIKNYGGKAITLIKANPKKSIALTTILAGLGALILLYPRNEKKTDKLSAEVKELREALYVLGIRQMAIVQHLSRKDKVVHRTDGQQ